MNNNKLEILVTAKDAASNVIQGVGKSFNQLGEHAMTGSKAMVAAVAVAGAAAVAFGKSSVDAYFAAAEATQKLSTNLLNVKGNTKANVDELQKLASHLQSVGVIEDDVIKAGMSQLATFNLQSSTIAKLTPKIADMVAQMKGHNATAEDMVGINNLVGKVITGNVGALSRYGVTLSDNQAEMIKNGTEAQKAATIVEVLGQNYGNVNEALRKTPQGMLTALKNDFGDLQEGVGEVIVNAFMPLLTVFNSWMTQVNAAGGLLPYFTQLIEQNKNTVIGIAGAITAMLLPALISWAVAAAPVVAVMAAIGAAGYFLAPIINNLVQGIGGWGVVFNTLKDVAQQAFNILMIAFNALWPSIVSVGENLRNNLFPALMELWNLVSPLLIPVLKVVAALFGATLIGAIWLFINAINVAISIITSIVREISGWINTAKNLAGTIGSVVGSVISWFQKLPGVAGTSWGAVGNAIMTVMSVLNPVIGAIRLVIDLLGKAGGAMNAFKGVGKALHIPGFATGGFTGRGGSNDVAGIVHKGEYVVPKRYVDQNTGLPMGGMGGGNTNQFFGKIEINTADAANAFWDRMDREGQLAELGVAL